MAGHPRSITIIAIDRKQTYYLYGTGASEPKHCTTGMAMPCDAMKDPAEQVCGEVELEGVNSPKRGDFKPSFGGSPIPFYHLSRQNQGADQL